MDKAFVLDIKEPRRKELRRWAPAHIDEGAITECHYCMTARA